MAEWQWWPTVDETAADVRRWLSDGDADMAMRMLLDGVNQLADAHREGQLDAAIAEPSPIGDVRWDTLLAAAVRYRLHSLGVRAPRWTMKPPLERFWWPTRLNPSQQYSDLVHAPAELIRVGIFMDERDFEAA
ncbi:MAG: hypothetical protein QM619_10945 [Micropruina sp.]|uniref:hypothetical protein n=1 Tax=Micropruina sp. TaxID=2737536 RepID=UPI0039E6F5DA